MTTAIEPGHLTYAIVGTGALGGFYGARLQQAGAEVHFLLHRDYDHVQQQGLWIESPDGDFRLPTVHAYQHPGDMPACDVVIIALKTTQNHLLPTLLPPLVQAHTRVLMLQNGLQVEDHVATLVEAERVFGGLCFLCSNKVGPGHICHLDYKKIVLGAYSSTHQPRGVTPHMQQITADFERAGIPIELAADLVLARWKKLVWNIPFNGLSVVLDATTDQLMADEQARTLAQELMDEVVQGARAQGRTIPADFVATMLTHTAEMKPYRTSMKIDFDLRRPLEIDAMYGNPLRVAADAGVDLPKTAMLYQQLRFLDARNRSA